MRTVLSNTIEIVLVTMSISFLILRVIDMSKTIKTLTKTIEDLRNELNKQNK